MRIITYLFAALISSASALQSGVTASMAISVIEQGKDAYFDSIMRLINSVDLPDVYAPDGKGYMLENKFVLLQRTENVEFSTDVKNNAVLLTCRKMSGQFYSNHFYYKAGPGLKADGDLEVDLNTITVQIGIGFETQTMPDGRILPKITSQDVIFDIDRFDLAIHLHGTLFTDFINLFTPFFKSVVVSMINESVSFVLETGIPTVANTLIDFTDGFLPIPLVNEWVLDWETPAAALVTEDSISIGSRGLFFDRLYGEQEPDVAIPNLPYYNSTLPQQFQASVSAYSIDAFFGSWLEISEIKGWFNSSMIPEQSHLKLTTTTLASFLPGIVNYYGANMPVDVHFEILALSNFTVEQNNEQMGGLTTVVLEFWVETSETTQDLATSMTLIDTTFKFTALIENMVISINLGAVNVDKISVNSCSFGKLSALTLKVELNNFFRIFTPVINSKLAKHPITFPSNIFGIFTLSNLTLGYFDNYIYVGATPTFIQPKYVEIQRIEQLLQNQIQ